jgi:iron(III) transport system ATP-binding protein
MTAPVGIEFIDVTKRYAPEAEAPAAVRNVSFSLPQGQLTTLLGPSGCGKTTTLRLIAGLETPTSGRILLGGRDVTTLGPSDRNVTMMFQSYALFPHMTVAQNVAYGLRMSGVARDEAASRADLALRGVGLSALGARMPSELSGGQQQRVALARALVLEPAVLLFDEPLSNLDARLRREMREEIRAVQQRLGLTVAYVTHDQAEALAVSDHIVVMDHGVIAQQGTPQELYERPGSAFVAGFMGEAMLFPVRVEGDAVRLGPLRIPCSGPVPAKASVAVRPEAWTYGPPGEGLSARVTKRSYVGHGWEYTVDTELGPVFLVSRELDRVLQVGDDIGMRLGTHGVSVVPGTD